MKKLFYFSKSKLQFIEIRNFKAKLLLYFTLSVIVVSSLMFGAFYFFTSITDSQKSLHSLRLENKSLRENLGNISAKYKEVNDELDKLTKENNTLRVAANLQPLSDDERMVGIGGGSFDNSLDFLTDPTEVKLKDVLNYVDEVSRKIEFAKSEYLEISNKLKENKKLYAAIPAIRPCIGPISDGFGMRMHPILHIRRMHDGIDIVADYGSPVYAPGNGVVDFVGHKEGYGLTVEIDHGFGYRTIYAHLSKSLVREGEHITRGDEIAKTGDSGLSTGPHLHYEVHHNGVKLNPENFFFGDLGYFELTSKN